MRIAAGILLILVALANGCAGLGYTLGGGMTAAVGSAGDLQPTPEADEAPPDDAPPQMAPFDGAPPQNADEMVAAGAGLAAFGIFLLILMGLQLGGALALFTDKAAIFVMVVGGLGVIAEGVGMLITNVGVINIIGILVSLFAIFGAWLLMRQNARDAAPLTAAAGDQPPT